MIYLIEFAILHLLFYVVYKALLSRETQLNFLRRFLLTSTLISLVVPALNIPSSSSIPTINTESFVLPAVNLLRPVSESPSSNWVGIILAIAGTIVLCKLLLNLLQLRSYYRKSNHAHIEDIPVLEVKGLNNSFTFFKWIFIDTHFFHNPKDIVRHELGHAKKLHSVDLIFFYLLSILFWWVPSIWLMLKELKKVHEFEADQYAISLSGEAYVKTLVHSTLKAHGVDLASSFDDATIFNRLNFIKKMKKKMNPLKIASISCILAISAIMFACEEKLESEIKRIADESNQQTSYPEEVEVALAKLRAENPDEVYAVVETKIENEETIKKLQNYDPDQIEHLYITKNEGEESIVMIVNQNSSLFEQTIDVQRSTEDGNVFTVTEDVASFPDGLSGWGAFLAANMQYPAQARRLGVEGRVTVEFIVQEDGSLTDIKVLNGIGAGCDAEAVRIMKASPDWIAGKVDGKKVKQRMVQSINFKLP